MGKKISEFLSINIFRGDKGVWMIYFLLCMVSLVVIYSAGSNLTFNSEAHWAPLVNQAIFLAVGLLVIIGMNSIPCKYFKLIPIIGLPIAILLLLWLLAEQKLVNGAGRWIEIFGVRFQPSELAKSMLILSVSVTLAKVNNRRLLPDTGRNHDTNRANMLKAFKLIGLQTLITCGLILPENFSTAAMLFLVIFTMVYIGNIPKRLLIKTILVLAAFGAFATMLMMTLPEETLADYKRVLTWKHRIVSLVTQSDDEKEDNSYNMEEYWQVNHSHIAIANSNVIGLGPGNSIERDMLPHAESDFIYSIIIEEYGIAGGLFVLMLYVTLLVRAWRIARRCDKYFPSFLVVGLSLMLVIQAFVNMAVAVGLAPVTGQTLPLISHGGTSIIITSFNIGMILSVSRYAEKVDKQRKEAENTEEDASEAEFGSAEGME